MTHVFQPFNLDDIDINPFTKIGKEWALITAGNKEKYNTMTVSWGGMGILWGKKVAFLFIRDFRYTKEFIDNNDLLSISFLSEQYRDALNYCGTHSGRTENKFAGANLTPAFRHNIPYVDEANFVLLCNKLAAVPIEQCHLLDQTLMSKWYQDSDMHTMYVVEIIESLCR